MSNPFTQSKLNCEILEIKAQEVECLTSKNKPEIKTVDGYRSKDRVDSYPTRAKREFQPEGEHLPDYDTQPFRSTAIEGRRNRIASRKD